MRLPVAALVVSTVSIISTFGAPRIALAESIAGTWLVTVEGPVKTRCVAKLADRGGALSGTVACREAGIEIRIDGQAQGGFGAGSAPGGVTWTAAREGSGLVGSYASPRGSGTWSARRAPGS
jgi:hypothetical protein